MTYTHEKITKNTVETVCDLHELVTDLEEVVRTIKSTTIDQMEGSHIVKVFIKPMDND